MSNYNVQNWYWIVAGSTTQVYSSAAAAYVSVSDAIYLSWLAAGGVPTKITANDMLILRIGFLENQQTLRRMREAAAGSDGGWLTTLNTQIAALRAQLV